MTTKQRNRIGVIIRYAFLIIFGLFLIYPLIWMVGATFKTNSEIFTSVGFIPKAPTTDGYKSLLDSYGGDINLFKSMLNTLKIVVPKLIFTVISSVLTAYGFARFEFKGKGLFFGILISTIFLPQVVLNAPQYVMFSQMGWTGSYKPLIIPSLFAADAVFVFMLIQFFRGVPREMDQASCIDGCNSLQTLIYVLVPVIKPAITSVALFSFLWSWNDFMGPLIYVTNVKDYTVSVFLRMSMDAEMGFSWNKVLAASLISMIPSLTIFFLSQNNFIEGLNVGGIKG